MMLRLTLALSLIQFAAAATPQPSTPATAPQAPATPQTAQAGLSALQQMLAQGTATPDAQVATQQAQQPVAQQPAQQPITPSPQPNPAAAVPTVAPVNDDILTKIPTYTDPKDLVYTATRKKTADGIIEALGKATKTVDISGFIVNHPDILKMIQDLKKKGVTVRIFMQKGDVLKGMYAATDNNAAEATFSESVSTKASFLPDIKSKEFRYALQKAAYIVIDDSFGIILTQLPQSTGDKSLIAGLFSPSKELIAVLKKIMDSDHEGTPEKTDESVSDFHDSAQVYLGSNVKIKEKLMDFCRESKETIIVETASLSDPEFFNFLIKMKDNERTVKILVGELTQDRVLENIAFRKGIDLRVQPSITGTTILLDPDKDSQAMFMGGFSLTSIDLAFARYVGWSHKNQDTTKNAKLVFDVLWKEGKEMTEVK